MVLLHENQTPLYENSPTLGKLQRSVLSTKEPRRENPLIGKYFLFVTKRAICIFYCFDGFRLTWE
jgi:hypothetical protein